MANGENVSGAGVAAKLAYRMKYQPVAMAGINGWRK